MTKRKRGLPLLQLSLLLSVGSSWCSIRHDLKRDGSRAAGLAIGDVDILTTRRLAESGGASSKFQQWWLVKPMTSSSSDFNAAYILRHIFQSIGSKNSSLIELGSQAATGVDLLVGA